MTIIPNRLAFWRSRDNQTNVNKRDTEIEEAEIGSLTVEHDIDRVREKIRFDCECDETNIVYDEVESTGNGELEFRSYDEASEDDYSVEFRNEGQYKGSYDEFEPENIEVKTRTLLRGGRVLTVNPDHVVERKPKFRHDAYIQFTYENIPVQYTYDHDADCIGHVCVELSQADMEWEVKYRA
jgi:hypothetical protein